MSMDIGVFESFNERRNIDMDHQVKLQGLQERLHRLEMSKKDTNGVQRRVRREIRNLEKELKQQKEAEEHT